MHQIADRGGNFGVRTGGWEAVMWRYGNDDDQGVLMKQDRLTSAGRYAAPGHDRLLYLAEFLATVNPDHITFSRWYGGGKGCAVGLAAMMDPRLQAQGLSLANEDSLKECRPVCGGKSDWEAVCAFFSISHPEATVLFTPAGYHGELRPHPLRIAARIYAFVGSDRPEANSETRGLATVAA